MDNRYPPAVLEHGYTPTPNLVRRAWPALGATYGAYFLYETIISYQRDAAAPAVYVDQLAADLQINPRRVRALTAQLVGLGLLVVGRARDGRNLYDFRPLYARVAAETPPPPLDPTPEAPNTAPEAPDTAPSGATDTKAALSGAADIKAALSVRDSGRKPAPYEETKNSRLDSISPTPCGKPHGEPADADAERQAVAAAVAALGAELGDVAPRSSTTRALRAFENSGLSAAVFLQLVDEARRITQRRQRKAPSLTRPMAFWFEVLRALIDDHVATATAVATAAVPPAAALASAAPGATTRPRSCEASPAPASSPPPPPQPDDAWGAIRAEIAREVTPENYARWFAPTRQVHDDAGALTIAVPDPFHLQWLDQRLRSKIEACATRVLPGSQVLFTMEA